jgi:hypothetical protein
MNHHQASRGTTSCYERWLTPEPGPDDLLISWVIVTIAGEWQRGGHLRDGNIVAIRAKRFALN